MRISKQIKEFKTDITKPCVYEIYNTTSGKRYIGFTGELKSRFAEHFYSLRKGNHYIEDMQADYDAGMNLKSDACAKWIQSFMEGKIEQLKVCLFCIMIVLSMGIIKVITNLPRRMLKWRFRSMQNIL